ncbi:hypothetical protein [Confluentibacter flavum]|uniref:Phosphoribosylpyrophosphate synthetase n=1 Tax=Confluentibacter flavum TaxID=1909700 RepID=A0A2N3HJT9_9FLAO|nr:hypothetical protein [Confluentibacter flavum]PKQ45142.1 hypothetical protein CSW08_09650 [Confluentibacter flavum]
MDNKYAKHEKDYIKVYQDKGYTSNFYFKNNKLINSETKEEYFPQDILIVAEHRYEGMSDPSDMSILYIISTSKDEKGTFLMAYGPTADMDISEFFNEIPKANITNDENINENDSSH